MNEDIRFTKGVNVMIYIGIAIMITLSIVIVVCKETAICGLT